MICIEILVPTTYVGPLELFEQCFADMYTVIKKVPPYIQIGRSQASQGSSP
jgi:hypothetical protein